MTKYYFEFMLEFPNDYHTADIEKLCGLKPSKATDRINTKTKEFGDFIVKSKEMDSFELDLLFKKYVEKIYDKFLLIKNVIEENKASSVFYIVFNKLDNEERPAISFDKDTLHKIAEMSSRVELDFNC